MAAKRPQSVTIDTQAITHLLDYCQAEQISRLLLVADGNTFAVLGRAVEAGLQSGGLRPDFGRVHE